MSMLIGYVSGQLGVLKFPLRASSTVYGGVVIVEGGVVIVGGGVVVVVGDVVTEGVLAVEGSVVVNGGVVIIVASWFSSVPVEEKNWS